MHRLRYALEFVGCVAISAIAGILLRHHDKLYFALIILGFGVCAGFLAHLAIGLRAGWRFHYFVIYRFYILTLVAIASYVLAVRATDKADNRVARDYLAQIEPQLEDFRQTNGHYPNALDDLRGLPTPPPGFIYRRDKNAVSDNADAYRIYYFSEEYWSATKKWQVDD